MKKNKKPEKVREQSSYQYIMRHLDIYGQPLQWYIGNDKTYNTIVGGCRTFFVIGAALIFLIYSIYQLFTSREGSYVFYDIVFSEISDESIYYYQDFEIFFFFQTSGHQMMQMNTDILKAVIKQTKASDDSSSSSESTESTRLRNLRKRKNRKLQFDDTNNQENEGTTNENGNTGTTTDNGNTGTTTDNDNTGTTTDNGNTGTTNENDNTGTTTDNGNTSPSEENQNENQENNENNNNESSSEDDVIAKYTFYECDNKYFTDQLGFSNTVSEGLSSTYCLNHSSSEELNFTLSPLNPLGISSNPLTFTFEQNCQSSKCTSQENQQFQRIINQIKTLKIFIKTRITNPLNLENPIQSQVNTFTLTKSHLGSTIYFKKYLIETDSSLIPYIVGAKKIEFLSFDYEKENTDSDANNYYLSFALSNTKSYLTRNYEKLDNSLANFLAVFNALEIAGKILTFFFSSFSNEIFIFNYILKDRLYKKNNKFFSNPPKKNNYNKIDNFTLGNNNLKINSNDDDDDIQIENNNNNNNLLIMNKNKNNKNSNLIINDDLISKHSKKDSDVSSLNKINNNNNKNNNKIKSFETAENLTSNNQLKEKKNIKNNNNEEEINLNFLKNFWSVVLMTFDKSESKYKDVEDALEKIRLIQNIFDSSVYINLVFDIIRLKKVIFNETQEKLFNSIHFSTEEIDEYIKKYQNNQEFLTKEEIIKIKINLSNEKQNKLTQNIFENLKI